MKSVPPLSCLALVLALVGMLQSSTLALDDLMITEIMAVNDKTLADEDGDFPDWIEIYNAGTNTVNLQNWLLANHPDNPGSWWRFPQTNLPPNQFMVVFASGKDRRIAGQPLHTNFKLNNTGDYLALARPDGSTVSVYPTYPLQVAGVSYGIPVISSTILLVSNGSPAKFTVPLNDSLGSSWTDVGFADSSWVSVSNGVGFEAGGSIVALSAPIADSVAEFSGNQGSNNWFYGYWDKKADANGVYETADFTPFPRGTTSVLSSTNYWNGSKWDFPTALPLTELTAAGGHPAGDNGNPANPIHWVIRRYVSETNGALRITGTIANPGTNLFTGAIPGSCGDGVVGRILVDGVEVFNRAVSGASLGYSIIVQANLGSLIDFALDPGGANNDQCDTNSVFTAVIRTAGDFGPVADSIADWSDRGIQGFRGWSYGSFTKTNSAVVYSPGRFAPFPSGSGPNSTANFWTGELWHWFGGDPPFDTIGQTICQPSIYPSGNTNGFEHWVIRRWVSEITGAVSIDWHFSKKDLSSLSASSGVTAKIFHNGTQRDSIILTPIDFVGATKTVSAFNVQVGDFIDFTVEPGADVVGDICLLNATIYGATTLSNQFNSDVGQLMTNINASAYLRIPFTVGNAAAVSALSLKIKYDDGFIAYLNGTPVLSRNFTGVATNWNSTADRARTDAEASQFEDVDLTAVIALGVLRDGNNVLAIQGLNSSATDQDFLIVADLRGTIGTANPTLRVYFSAPTPGAPNGAGAANIGPLITKIHHTPNDPDASQSLAVTAKVTPTFKPVGTVRLYYRVMFGSESNVVMFDDGLHNDGAPGDGVYGAAIPGGIATFGQMIRYYITAADTNNLTTRQPLFPDPSFSAQYFGTVVQDPSLTNPLPVLHLFITPSNLDGANNNNTTRYPCSMYWLGEFYDNLGINRHGQSSAGFPKKSYDVDFNADHHFKWAEGEARVDDINLLTTYPDKGHMRNLLSYYGVYRPAGSPYHFVVPVRMQTNGGFYGDWDIVENGDVNFLKRIKRSPNGALYKMYNTFTSPANTIIGSDPNAEKKTRKFEGSADLLALYNGVNGIGTNRVTYMYDNVNIAESINMAASRIVTSDVDCCHKNYYFYRDTEGTGEWEAFPWDVDLSFGRNWNSTESYWDDRVYPQNGLFVGNNNSYFVLLFNTPATRQMYFRRLRTLMDELQQTNGTPAGNLFFEKMIDDLAATIAPDAALDLARWGTWGGGATGIFATNNQYYRTLPQSVAETKTNYLVNRRKFVFDQKMNAPTEWPNSQPTNVTILIGALDYSPVSGNQAEEYLQLINTNNIAVDISGWKLSGAVDFTFQGGVVLVSNSVLYVAADKNAFRRRAVAPTGGQNLYVEGSYKGQLSARGEILLLSDRSGRIVNTNAYQGTPSGPQQWLRVTEIMYHPPAPPSGSLFDAEDFEYIELRNTGPTNINLAGVHFSSGIAFTFPASSLAPGAHVLVVRSQAAFTSRYGAALNVAGQYSGILNNSGENIRLDDAVGEKILDFTYNNSWYPITDGPGASLVIRDATADWHSWGLKESWRPSALDFGSPGASDGTPAIVAEILVNEALTHTDPPLVDAIELYNPTAAAVNLSGWFLSDDFATPKKYRIPAGTTIAAGGYLVFYETNSFATGPNPFSLSSLGDETFLFSGDGDHLTGYFHGFSFGAAESGVSFGRFVNSQTNTQFVAQQSNSLGAANGLPKVGPLVISEINYRPLELVPGVDNTDDEFIEVANVTSGNVDLFDSANPANTWRLRSAVDFDFPPGISLAAGGHLILVSFNPADQSMLAIFRARFGVPAGTQVLGPFSGQLGNTGESVRLYRPRTPSPTAPATVPYILVDQIDYENHAPWPAAADGFGLSLQRLVESSYGNESTNWIAVIPSAGVSYVSGGTPPTITSQPGDVSVLVGGNAQFRVTVDGTTPFFYQWRTNGVNLAGANGPVLTLNNVRLAQALTYSVVVFNSAGSAESLGAKLTVLVPVSIAVHPQPVTLRGSTNNADYGFTTNNAVFNVLANVQRPTRYQWRYNGVPISGETASTLTVPNVGLPQEGNYDVVVTDDVSSATSAPARLKVLVTPQVLQPPVPQLVTTNGFFTASVVIRGNPPPFRYEWREISLTRATNITSDFTNFFTFGPLTSGPFTNKTTQWRLVIFNDATPPQGVISSFNVVSALDTDGDGIPDALDPDPSNAGDRDLDPDGDGLSNYLEYLAGTDPASASSNLKLTPQINGDTVLLSFDAQPNKTYSVQYSDNLGEAAWIKFSDIFATATGHPVNLVVPNPRSTRFYRFYRVVTPRQP